MEAWYAITAGGAQTLTATLGQMADVNLVTFEYSGVAQPGAFAFDAGFDGAPGAGPVTTTVPGSLLIVYAVAGSLGNAFTGFMTESNCNADLLSDRTAAVPGTYSATYDTTYPDYWHVALGVFEPASDGGATLGSDGGTDAGLPASDAGGWNGPRLLKVGCGCDATELTGAAVAAAVLRRRRTRPRVS
jgi:hypothetical protein